MPIRTKDNRPLCESWIWQGATHFGPSPGHFTPPQTRLHFFPSITVVGIGVNFWAWAGSCERTTSVAMIADFMVNLLISLFAGRPAQSVKTFRHCARRPLEIASGDTLLAYHIMPSRRFMSSPCNQCISLLLYT